MKKRFTEHFDSENTVKVVFAGPVSGAKYIKMNARPVEIRGEKMWQLEYSDGRQSFHKNSSDPLSLIFQNHIDSYTNIAITNPGETVQLLRLQNGKIRANKKANNVKALIDISHDKVKNYIINPGDNVPALVDIGIFTKDLKVVKSMSDKFRQINRFLEIVSDTTKDISKKEFTIVDFGCGKSYLTFVLYHYFANILKVPVKIYGYDLKKSVIQDCNASAKKYGYKGLEFIHGDIKTAFDAGLQPDMIVTLHACDIATDIALYHSIVNNVPFVFSVPCCQHEINAQIKTNSDMSLLLEDGLIKERFSALLTDTIRASILRQAGYKTDVIEFVDFEATPKSLMLRATKTGPDFIKADYKPGVKVSGLLDRFHIKQSLNELLLGNSIVQTGKACKCDH